MENYKNEQISLTWSEIEPLAMFDEKSFKGF